MMPRRLARRQGRESLGGAAKSKSRPRVEGTRPRVQKKHLAPSEHRPFRTIGGHSPARAAADLSPTSRFGRGFTMAWAERHGWRCLWANGGQGRTRHVRVVRSPFGHNTTPPLHRSFPQSFFPQKPIQRRATIEVTPCPPGTTPPLHASGLGAGTPELTRSTALLLPILPSLLVF